jgi:phosphate transport system substrate-binding protein
MDTRRFFLSVVSAHLAFAVISCGGEPGGAGKTVAPEIITADGSSTVYPISEAVAEEFQRTNTSARITVGISGTGGGFQKFCRGEVDIANASRPIRTVEMEACAKGGIEFIELPVAYDGLAVIVNPRNSWVDAITVAELKRLWSPEAQGKITRWSQIRAGWPDREIHLFGAGVDSGTYDYFTSAIVGTEGTSRGDFTSSEDDNVIVQGISTDELALGFFGYAYYEANHSKLKLVPVNDGNDDNGKGAIAPSVETVKDGTYQPLSRPIFIYVARKSLERPDVRAFIEFYLTQGPALVREVGYVPLGDSGYKLAADRLSRRTLGSVFEGGSQVGVTLEELLAREK